MSEPVKNFALIGAAGFVAPRHLKAIRETGNRLLAALDKTDSVGVLDAYFPEADFFLEFERFDRHLEKLRRREARIDYLSVCSPNYLHDAHIRFGLRYGADVICEKPLVLNPWNAEALQEMEAETGRRIYTILQLRLHPVISQLREEVLRSPDKVYDIDLTYLTSRGNWYHTSWKGQVDKSGGIATNIGIHFFDMLIWIFGPVQESWVYMHTHDRAAGFLQLARARVRWFLSTDRTLLPDTVSRAGGHTWRSIRIDDRELEFSDGFTDLHTASYRDILTGGGFGAADAAPSIELVHTIRTASISTADAYIHPLASGLPPRSR